MDQTVGLPPRGKRARMAAQTSVLVLCAPPDEVDVVRAPDNRDADTQAGLILQR